MASAHGLTFIQDLTISSASTGLYDAQGNALATADILLSGNTAYSKPFLLSPKATDFILSATCEGCELKVTLEMSPDNINWCPCPLSNGDPCEITCTDTVGDCTTKVVDVALLQFVRVKVGEAGSQGGTCSVRLHFTLN